MTIFICMVLVLFRCLQLRLGRFTRCLSGWNSLKPSKAVAPFSEEIVLALTWYLINKQRLTSAFVLMVLFYACLRETEALILTRDDVAFPEDIRLWDYGLHTAGVNIRDAETSRNSGRFQFVFIKNSYCIKFMKEFYELSSKSGRIIDIKNTEYLSDLKDTSEEFTFPSSSFRTHVARIGSYDGLYPRGTFRSNCHKRQMEVTSFSSSLSWQSSSMATKHSNITRRTDEITWSM